MVLGLIRSPNLKVYTQNVLIHVRFHPRTANSLSRIQYVRQHSLPPRGGIYHIFKWYRHILVICYSFSVLFMGIYHIFRMLVRILTSCICTNDIMRFDSNFSNLITTWIFRFSVLVEYTLMQSTGPFWVYQILILK